MTIFKAQTFSFLYSQQEAIYLALYSEVSEAKATLRSAEGGGLVRLGGQCLINCFARVTCQRQEPPAQILFGTLQRKLVESIEQKLILTQGSTQAVM